MEAVQQKVTSAVHQMMDNLDKSHLRKLQGNLHRCAAKCCDNTKLSMQEEQDCVEDCGLKLQHFQQTVQAEMKDFQSRLERCAMSCQDEIRDKTGSQNPTMEDIDRLRPRMLECATKCADTHVDYLPKIEKRLEETLRK